MPCFVTCLWAWSYRVYSWRMGFHHVLICSMQISPVSVDMYEHIKKKKMIIKLIPFHWQLSVGNYNLEVSLFLSALLHTPFPSSKALFCQSKGSSAQGLEFSLPSSENRTGVWKISYWELWNDKWELDSISARTVLPSGYVCAQRGGNVFRFYWSDTSDGPSVFGLLMPWPWCWWVSGKASSPAKSLLFHFCRIQLKFFGYLNW